MAKRRDFSPVFQGQGGAGGDPRRRHDCRAAGPVPGAPEHDRQLEAHGPGWAKDDIHPRRSGAQGPGPGPGGDHAASVEDRAAGGGAGFLAKAFDR